MIAYIAAAAGAPGSTLVVDRRTLPLVDSYLTEALFEMREALVGLGRPDVLKIALISPGNNSSDCIDYEFVQFIPGEIDRFDASGTCGNSLLASVVVADELGWIPRLVPGSCVRVRTAPRGEHVLCEVEATTYHMHILTAHFISAARRSLSDILIADEPITELDTINGPVSASLVAAGNPYVFVDAADLGITTINHLFAGGDGLRDRLEAIRRAAAVRLTYPASGAFPKVAVVGHFDRGVLGIRALSVPKWHPSVGLTGAVCLGAATMIPGTIPHHLAESAECRPGGIVLRTPSSLIEVTVSLADFDNGPTLVRASIAGNIVTFEGAVDLEVSNSYRRGKTK